jgi:hypothetical protein
MTFDRGTWEDFVDDSTVEVHGSTIPYWGPVCRYDGHGPMEYFAHTGLRIHYWCQVDGCSESAEFWTWEIDEHNHTS